MGIALRLFCSSMLPLALLAAAGPAGAQALSDHERATVLVAAGAQLRDDRWVICTDDPDAAGARIDLVRDLNGDGRPEALVVEDGTWCHGFIGTGFQLLSRQVDGSWRRITAADGMPEFLATRGKGGWPDLLVGGPGFCFPVQRWNGRDYVLDRFEYNGQRCEPK